MRTILHDGLVAVEEVQTGDNETINGAGVDMQGFDAVAFIVAVEGGEADDFSIKAQQDSDSGFGTAADLEGTSVSFSTTTGADAYAILEVVQPQERYVRPVLTVPDLTAAKSLAIISVRYRSIEELPQTNTGELHVSPDEGTA